MYFLTYILFNGDPLKVMVYLAYASLHISLSRFGTFSSISFI